MIEALSARLRSGDYTVGVVGLGYVASNSNQTPPMPSR